MSAAARMAREEATRHTGRYGADDRIEVRCYAELNDCLPPERRQRTFRCPLPPGGTVGAVVAALGLPADAVDLALVNGRAAEFGDPVHPGDRLALYPVFEALDIAPLTRLPGRPLRDPRFVADVHLGGLARLLRMLGFDVLWRPDWDDATLAAVAAREGRILLSRDRRLLERRAVTRAWRPPAGRPRAQLAAVCARLQLLPLARPFTRCMVCNAPVEAVPKDAVAGRLPPRVLAAQQRFFRCTGCAGVYWEGSHHRDMQALLARLAADEELGTE